MLKQIEVTKSEETNSLEATKFSFAKIIPMPDSEKDNWYEWRVSNWGTKWNADVQMETTDEWESGSVLVEFNTAWSPATPVITTLSRQHPSLTFYWRYHEESNAYWGNHTIKNGVYLESYEGDFSTCHEYNEFGLMHHECLVCQNWVDECNNSDTRELEACESCLESKAELEAELSELETELWGEVNAKENAV
jgi:hypothetical protein